MRIGRACISLGIRMPTLDSRAAHPAQASTLDRIFLRLLMLYGVAALAFLALVPRFFLPAEDAVILFAYSRNLALHGAITYVAGGPRVEGATDFGWMALIAGAQRLGLDPFVFCAAANVVCLLGLAVALLRLARVRVSAAGVLLVAGAAALFRPIFAAASGFSVLPNALGLALLVLFVTGQRARAASVTALCLCLLRPDGVVFAVPLLFGLLQWTPRGARRAALVAIATLFLLPGALYFLWRWQYFGEPWPLPFLVKANFHRELGFLVRGSVRASLVPLLFTGVVLAPLVAVRRRETPLLFAALVAVPTLFFWTVRLDQNVGARFFFYLPAGVAILLAFHWQALASKRILVFRLALVAYLLLLAAPQYREWLTFRYMQFGNVQAIARALQALPQHGTLLASEAGFVPYNSGWPSEDPWGLNSPEFAHRFFQAADVGKLRPDLIVTHPDLGDPCIEPAGGEGSVRYPESYPDRAWPHMTYNLVRGAAEAGYELWLTPYGSDFYQRRKHWRPGEGDRECWFVRPRSPLRWELEQVLSTHGGIAPMDAEAMERRRLAPAR